MSKFCTKIHGHPKIRGTILFKSIYLEQSEGFLFVTNSTAFYIVEALTWLYLTPQLPVDPSGLVRSISNFVFCSPRP